MTRLLLDENLPQGVAGRLVAAGHDVLSLQSVAPGASDRDVLALARREARCLVTFDADFGALVFRLGEPAPPAIVYLRMHPIDTGLAADLILLALQEPVEGRFVVATPEGLRRRLLQAPTAGDGSR